jgi:type IV secretion system protein TrbE
MPNAPFASWRTMSASRFMPVHRASRPSYPRRESGSRALFAHFESRYFLTLLWLPPADDSARAEA